MIVTAPVQPTAVRQQLVIYCHGAGPIQLRTGLLAVQTGPVLTVSWSRHDCEESLP